MEQAISDLIKKYDAFVKLSTVDYDDILKLHELRSQKEKLISDINYLIDNYNKKIGDADKWEKKYSARTKRYNEAKHYVGEDSMSERVDRRYAESAQEMSSASLQDAQKIKRKIDELRGKISSVDSAYAVHIEQLKNGSLQYQYRAFETAQTVCRDFPYSPVGYLLMADHYVGEYDLTRELFAYGRKKFCADTGVSEQLKKSEKNADALERAVSEREKANKFLDAESRAECKTLITRVDTGIRKAKKAESEAHAPVSEAVQKLRVQNEKMSEKNKKLDERLRRNELDRELGADASAEPKSEERKARYKFWLKASIGTVAVCVAAFVVWYFFFR